MQRRAFKSCPLNGSSSTNNYNYASSEMPLSCGNMLDALLKKVKSLAMSRFSAAASTLDLGVGYSDDREATEQCGRIGLFDHSPTADHTSLLDHSPLIIDHAFGSCIAPPRPPCCSNLRCCCGRTSSSSLRSSLPSLSSLSSNSPTAPTGKDQRAETKHSGKRRSGKPKSGEDDQEC